MTLWLPTFRKNLLPPSSRSTSILYNEAVGSSTTGNRLTYYITSATPNLNLSLLKNSQALNYSVFHTHKFRKSYLVSRIVFQLHLASLKDTYRFLKHLTAIIHWLPYYVDTNGNFSAAESMTYTLFRLTAGITVFCITLKISLICYYRLGVNILFENFEVFQR
jgi:hypothetical protein